MLGVTEHLLEADATEPQPLGVIRDRDGDLWIHAGGIDTEPWTQLTGDTAGSTCTWDDLRDQLAPLYAVERTSETYAPWEPPGETVTSEPSDFYLRCAALDAAARILGQFPPEPVADAELPAFAKTIATIYTAVAAALEPYLRSER